MTGSKPKQTMAEFLAEYVPPPEDYERHQEHLAHIARSRANYAHAAAGLLADLRAAGFDVRNMEQLREPGVGNAAAVPILLDWLPRIMYQPLARDIVATLAMPWARKAALRPLVEFFLNAEPDDDARDGGLLFNVGDTLEKIANDSVVDELIQIARDTRHGGSRTLVVLALGKLRKSREKVVPVLMKLLDERAVEVAAAMALGRLRVVEARPRIEALTHDPDSWVRNKARQALKKLPPE